MYLFKKKNNKVAALEIEHFDDVEKINTKWKRKQNSILGMCERVPFFCSDN